MSTSTPNSRWFHLTPDRFVIGLLLVEVFLLVSEWGKWFSFNEHKGWTVLIGVAVLGAAILVLVSWLAVGLVRRRAFRFGLRTLMLFVVVCAVVCSWFSVKMNQARRQREAVEAIIAVGGSVVYDYQYVHNGIPPRGGPPGHPWGRELLGNDFFSEVVSVCAVAQSPDTFIPFNFVGEFDDGDMEHLRALPGLKNLLLNNSPVTDAGLKHVAALKNLEMLYLYKTQVTDAGLEHVMGLTKLRLLMLPPDRTTDESVTTLKQALPNCRIHRNGWR